MVNVELEPGQHTIKISLANHSILEAVINISDTGTVTCVSVSGGLCGSATPPSIVISGIVVLGYLKELLTDTCAWVTDKGGWESVVTYDIMDLIKGYSGAIELGFTVTSAHIMGAIAYYSGNVESGNSLMRCSF